MRKSLAFAFSILFLIFQTEVFAQTETSNYNRSNALPLVAAAKLNDGGDIIESYDKYYIILNADGSGLFYADGFVSKITWNMPDDNTVQFTDRIGDTYIGSFIDEYLSLECDGTTYFFELRKTIPIMDLLPEHWAQGIRPFFFIEDEAMRNEIGEEKIAEINSKAAQISEHYGTDIHIIIVNNYYDYSTKSDIELFAEEISDGYRLGLDKDENALLLVMSMSERDYDIYASGKYTNEIFNSFSRSLLEDAMLPYFKYNNWADGFNAYLDECLNLLELAENGEIYTRPPRNYKLEIIISLIIGLFIALIARACVHAAYSKQVQQKSAAAEYIVNDSFKLSQKTDTFTHTTTSRTYSPRSSSSSSHSGGSRSSSHSSGKF